MKDGPAARVLEAQNVKGQRCSPVLKPQSAKTSPIRKGGFIKPVGRKRRAQRVEEQHLGLMTNTGILEPRSFRKCVGRKRKGPWKQSPGLSGKEGSSSLRGSEWGWQSAEGLGTTPRPYRTNRNDPPRWLRSDGASECYEADERSLGPTTENRTT